MHAAGTLDALPVTSLCIFPFECEVSIESEQSSRVTFSMSVFRSDTYGVLKAIQR